MAVLLLTLIPAPALIPTPALIPDSGVTFAGVDYEASKLWCLVPEAL